MEIISPLAQAYAEKYTTAEDTLLKEIAEYTVANHSKSHMLSGHVQGKLLEAISIMTGPKRILEIGTFTGYSAICLAKGLQNDGVLHTIELREEEATLAQQFFRRSFYHQQIILHIGNALEIIGELDEMWDLVFIDADKENYINYFNRVFPKLKPNGFILADNVLFHGQVLEKQVKGKSAKAIQAFNDYVALRKDVDKLMLPLRDGLYLIRKLY
jgi:predicted O-methyltransferase YrrM